MWKLVTTLSSHLVIVPQGQSGLVCFEWAVASKHHLRGERLEEWLIHWDAAQDLCMETQQQRVNWSKADSVTLRV